MNNQLATAVLAYFADRAPIAEFDGQAVNVKLWGRLAVRVTDSAIEWHAGDHNDGPMSWSYAVRRNVAECSSLPVISFA
jgi:hypothetical protein